MTGSTRVGARSALVAVVVVLMAAACGGDAPAASDGPTGSTAPPRPAAWSGFGFDQANSRFNPAETQVTAASVKTLTPAWHLEQLGGMSGTPAVLDGTVYFGDWNSDVHAVEAATGRELWRTRLDGGSIQSSPTVVGDAVYVMSTRVLHRLDRATGAVRWRQRVSDHPISIAPASPVVVDGLVLQGMASGELIFRVPQYTFRGSLTAFDAETGQERWRRWFTDNDERSGAGVGIWSTPSIDTARGLAFVGTGNTYEPPAAPLSDSVVAVRIATGEVVWSKQFTYPDVWSVGHSGGLDADVGSGPNLWSARGRDLVGAGDKRGVYHALDRATGDVVWETPMTEGSTLGGVIGTSAYGDGHVYVASNVGNPANNTSTGRTQVLALHGTTGTIVWRRELPGSIYASVTAVPGVVLVGTTEKAMIALDARGGQELWRFTAPDQVGAGPSVVDGTVYWGYGFAIAGRGSGIGGLYAFRPGTGTTQSDGGTGAPPGRGADVYRRSCAACHGPDGRGGVGPSMVGVAERRTLEDHVRIVREGIPGSQMNGFASTLTDAEIDDVVDYERTKLSPAAR